MNNPRWWGKPLLVFHLLMCCLWIYLFHADYVPEWMIFTAYWTIVGMQFTWGFTVGLIVGPSSANRAKLWWSALLGFLPIYFLYLWALLLLYYQIGLFWVGLFFATGLMLVVCQTFCGLLLGARAHLMIKELGKGD